MTSAQKFFVRAARQRGVAAVEFAVMMLVLVTLLMFAVEYGRLMIQYETLVKSARAAARYASTLPSTADSTPAKCLAVYGNTTLSGSSCAGTTALIIGLTASNVTIAYASLDSVSNKVTATITGLVYTPAFTTLGLSITFEDIAAVITQPK